ncbi:hypothetical protein ncot_00845 [Nocardioides sp. JQ2195]|uniref:phosphotransferase-like protein n=1 Tax=Nocardioides sp. JQ2195 TaxID=2592334 RepID=UPI00143EB6D0|nr:hypothetical protein [Nocardioides sp. JQ2195]QIX25292.1 hypothetical protein ncot_00845 [Nocardioides sp. JQ2195]
MPSQGRADELELRERTRGDRPIGLARCQRVFEHKDHDIMVDTTHTSGCIETGAGRGSGLMFGGRVTARHERLCRDQYRAWQ